MNKKEFRKILEEFTKNKDFMLNPDKDKFDEIANTILKNEKKYGLKLCPCQIDIVCPCNFKLQEIWKNKGSCLCGLFVKK